MKLISVTVRNYRIHKEVNIRFDSSLNLVGGENETGKSTLTEAIHRVLFLKSKQTGVLQASMISNRHPGHPEVELEFQSGDRRYRVAKRFSGASGTTSLTCEGETALTGPEAEERLAQVLGIDTAAQSRMTPNLLATRWSHLWVWQGSGWNDPSEEATREQDSLLSRLKDQGGGGAMQSELDGSVSSLIADLHAGNYTANGSIKAHSPLQKAQQEIEEAREYATRCQAEYNELSDAVLAFQRAEKTISESDRQLKKNDSDSSIAKQKLSGTNELESRIRLQDSAFQAAEREFRILRESDTNLADLQTQISRLSEQLDLEQKDLNRLADARDLRKEKLGGVGRTNDHLEQKLRDAADKKELAANYVRLLEVSARNDEISRQISELTEIEEGYKLKQRELARLPEVTAEDLERLQRIESDLGEARALLAAMGARITVVETQEAVSIDGEALSPGREARVDEDAVISIGEATKLQISPGGGTSLAEARERQQELSAQKQNYLSGLGVADLEAARKSLSGRQILETELASIRATLKGRDLSAFQREKEGILQDLEAARAAVARRTDLLTGIALPEPSSLSEARELLEKSTLSFEKAERDQRESKSERNSLQQLFEQAEEKWTGQKQRCDELIRNLEERKTRAGVFEESHGRASDRAQKLEKLRKAVGDAKTELEKSQRELAELQPDQLKSDLVRFDRVSNEMTRLRDEAREERAVAREQLRRDGSRDLRELVEEANARLEKAEEHFVAEERKSRAVRLLKDLFFEEQQELADQFTGPLVERISGYLECIFGVGATASVEMNEKGFGGLKLVRNGETFEFDSLSGGTREQAAAAVRLALAEILADRHGGSLPIVFDDAFANSDPGRIESLQRMLDLGARRGLQVIVLTCDPTRYASLGARTTAL